MSQSIAKVAIHIVYSTKNRKPWLKSRELCDELYAYKATILRDKADSPAIVINGVEDHPQRCKKTVAKVVKTFGNSSESSRFCL